MSEEKLEQSVDLLHSFWTMQRQLMCFIQEKSAEESLSVPQFTVLNIMLRDNSVNQKLVQEKTNIPKSTLSQAIDGLVQRDLLTREQMENDRRGMLLSITEDGKELLSRIHTDQYGIHDQFYEAVKHLSVKQMTRMSQLHEEVADYFNKNGRDADC